VVGLIFVVYLVVEVGSRITTAGRQRPQQTSGISSVPEEATCSRDS
jgi:hypothetical protein